MKDTVATMTQYDVYATPEDQLGTESHVGPHEETWQVVMEYSNRGDAKPPTKLRFTTTTFSSREAAMQEAERQAFDFQPPDPMSPQGRDVYRDGEQFLTVVHGAMSIFHFTTRAVQLLQPAPTP